MDGVIEGSFLGALPEQSEVAAALERSLRQAESYEDFLDRIRIFAQEQMFLIGTRILSGTLSAEQAGEAFARPPDTLIPSPPPALESPFPRLHRPVTGQQTPTLGPGKLAGRQRTPSPASHSPVAFSLQP